MVTCPSVLRTACRLAGGDRNHRARDRAREPCLTRARVPAEPRQLGRSPPRPRLRVPARQLADHVVSTSVRRAPIRSPASRAARISSSTSSATCSRHTRTSRHLPRPVGLVRDADHPSPRHASSSSRAGSPARTLRPCVDGLLPAEGFDARDPGTAPPGNLVFRGIDAAAASIRSTSASPARR